MSKTAKKKIAKKPPYSAKNEIARLWTQSKMQRETNKIHRERLEKQMSALHDRLTALESRSAPAEEWPKVGDLVVVSRMAERHFPENVGKVMTIGSYNRELEWVNIDGVNWNVNNIRPATEAEIADHKAKEEQRALEAGWAKFDVLQINDCTEDPISEEGAQELANLGLPHYRPGGYGNSYVGWCTDNKGPCIMGVGSLYAGQRLPEVEFLRRAKGTAAKRAEEERAKEWAKVPGFGNRVEFKDGPPFGKFDVHEARYIGRCGSMFMFAYPHPNDPNTTCTIVAARHEFTVIDRTPSYP